MANVHFVSEVARRLGCTPREITYLLYDRCVPDDATMLVNGRRLIPEASIPLIEAALLARKAKRERREEAVA
jgi:hypothetical protein